MNDIRSSLVNVIDYIELVQDSFGITPGDKKTAFDKLTSKEQYIYRNYNFIRINAIETAMCGVTDNSRNLRNVQLIEDEAERLVYRHMASEPNDVRWSVMCLLGIYL